MFERVLSCRALIRGTFFSLPQIPFDFSRFIDTDSFHMFHVIFPLFRWPRTFLSLLVCVLFWVGQGYAASCGAPSVRPSIRPSVYL